MLKAEGITKSYDGNRILHGISLSVEDGDFLSIMGESGSGKSTLLSILAGNMKPDEGNVVLDGEEISALSEGALARLHRTRIGFVYQALNLIPTLNAKDNILLPLYFNRDSIKEGEARLQPLAKALGISHLLTSMPDKMSGGERQRVAIARAMLHRPSVLFLDEPTGSLDSRNTRDTMLLLGQINRESGVTVIQVTHSADAASYGKRTITISDGQVVQ